MSIDWRPIREMGRILALAFTLWLLLSMTACNPFITQETRKERRLERKTERFLKRHPELLVKDTIKIIVPEIRLDTVIKTNTDLSGLDSLLSSFSVPVEHTREIIRYVRERPILTDTAYFYNNGLSVRVFQQGDHLGMIVDRPEQVIEKVVDKIKVVNLTFIEKLGRVFQTWGFLFLIALLILNQARKWVGLKR